MDCKKCGKKMVNGARFCVFCGAEHDANGQLIIKNEKVDYNKTVMANDLHSNPKNNLQVDYDKTVMANDNLQKHRVDYNKTVMADDIPQNNLSDYNKTVMANHNSNSDNVNRSEIGLKVGGNGSSKSNISNINKKSKKSSPIIIILCIVVIIIVILSILLSLKKKKNNKDVKETINTETIVETTESINVVSDFDSSAGYWSQDGEYFYRNGTIQKNDWVGDFYVGNDGRKVKNQIIDDTYYVDVNGVKVKNEWCKFVKNVNGVDVNIWYYFGEDGAKLRDTLTPDGYYVDENGIYLPGEEYEAEDSKRYIEKQNIENDE